MADPTLRVRQTLDNSQFKKGLRDSQQSARALSTSMKAIGGAIAGAFAISSISGFLKTSMQGLAQEEKANASLLNTLHGRTEATARLVEVAKKLSLITLYEDDEIISAQALLGVFVKQENQLSTLTPLVADFATKFGMGLDEAAKTVGKAFLGSGTAFKKLGFEIKGANGSAERFAGIVDVLNEKVGGAAVEAAETNMGSVEKLGKAWGELGEALVDLTGPTLSNIAKGLTDLTNSISRTFTSDSLTKWERFKVIVDGLLGLDKWAVGIMDAADARKAVEDEAAKALEQGPSRAGFEEFSAALEEIEALNKSNAEAALEAAKAMEKQAAAAKKAAEEMRKLQQESLSKITGGLKPITTGELTGSGAMTDQQSKILDAMSTVGGSRITGMQLPVEQVEDMQMALRELPGTYATVTEEMEATSQRLKSAFESISSALGNAIGEFIKGEAKFSDVATSLIQEIIKVVAGYLTESVAASFAGGASAGGPAAAFTGAAAAAAALSMFGAIVPALMAKGGVVPSGFQGDTYPALLSSGETVLPAPHKLDAMAGTQRVIIEGRIRNQDIYFANKQQTSKLSRYR